MQRLAICINQRNYRRNQRRCYSEGCETGHSESSLSQRACQGRKPKRKLLLPRSGAGGAKHLQVNGAAAAEWAKTICQFSSVKLYTEHGFKCKSCFADIACYGKNR